MLHWQRLRLALAFRRVAQYGDAQMRRRAVVLKLLRSRRAAWGTGVLRAWRSLAAGWAAAETRAAAMAERLVRAASRCDR